MISSVCAQVEHWNPQVDRPHPDWDYDGKQILGRIGQDICLWDAKTGKLRHRMKGHGEMIHAVQISPDGKLALSSSWKPQGPMLPYDSKDTRTILWDLSTGREKGSFEDQVGGAFRPDSQRFVTFSERKEKEGRFDAAVWETSTGRRLVHANLGDLHCNPYWGSLYFSTDSKQIVRLERQSGGLIFDAENGRKLGQFSGRFSRSIRYIPDGTIASSFKKDFRLTNFQTGETILSEPHDLKSYWRVVWTHDGKKAVPIPYKEIPLKIWDLKTGKIIEGDKNGPYPHRSVIVSPDNRRLAIMSGGAYVDTGFVPPEMRLYDMDTGKQIVRIEIAEWGMLLGFSPDGKAFLVGGSEFVIYNSEDGKRVRSFKLLDDVESGNWK